MVLIVPHDLPGNHVATGKEGIEQWLNCYSKLESFDKTVDTYAAERPIEKLKPAEAANAARLIAKVARAMDGLQPEFKRINQLMDVLDKEANGFLQGSTQLKEANIPDASKMWHLRAEIMRKMARDLYDPWVEFLNYVTRTNTAAIHYVELSLK